MCAAGLLALAACSTVPDAHYPPFTDESVTADFVVPAAGRLLVPASSRALVVRELALEPPPRGEHFGPGGERWLLYPSGTAVRVLCRYRAYANAEGVVPGPAQVLLGALRIERLEAP